MTQLQQILLGTIAVLMFVWWVTQPPTNPPERDVMAETPLSWTAPPADLDIELPEEPGWLINIDTSRPECLEMKKEILAMLAKNTANLISLGDCDRRMQGQGIRD